MKAHGYAKRQISPNGLLEMREITFSGSPKTMRDIARFLSQAADQMEKRRGAFGHMHIGEVCTEWLEKWPDVVVSTSQG
jgi:hypothetical protein